jgi:hypothetical protein
MNLYKEIDFELDGECYFDEEVEVTFDFTPGDPGRYYGRPEDCYPATDDEVEIEAVLFNSKDIYDHLSYNTLRMLMQECIDYANERRQDIDEDAPRGWRSRYV